MKQHGLKHTVGNPYVSNSSRYLKHRNWGTLNRAIHFEHRRQTYGLHHPTPIMILVSVPKALYWTVKEVLRVNACQMRALRHFSIRNVTKTMNGFVKVEYI